MPNSSECVKNVRFFQVRPIIQEEYKLDHLPAAYETVDKGNLRGKVVIRHS